MGILDGKRILVSGVANNRSIAWGIATSLHAQGATLGFSCVERNLRKVRKLAATVDSDLVVACDVQQDRDIQALFDTVGETWGRLDGFVHSLAFAKVDDLERDFLETSRDGFALAMDVSVYSLIAMARHARPLMQQAGGGSIATLTFLGGERVVPGYKVMGVVKAALNMTVPYLAWSLGKDAIRVNAVAAAPIRTISTAVLGGLDQAFKLMEARSPLHANITKEQVGDTVAYLMSDLSRAVTAEIINVDSGVHAMSV